MPDNKSELQIGDLVYLTCDTTRKCLMTVASLEETKCSVIFVDKNNVPQSIEMLDKQCLKQLMI